MHAFNTTISNQISLKQQKKYPCNKTYFEVRETKNFVVHGDFLVDIYEFLIRNFKFSMLNRDRVSKKGKEKISARYEVKYINR